MEEDKLKNEEVFEIVSTSDGIMININMLFNTKIKSEVNLKHEDKKSLLALIATVEYIKCMAIDEIKKI